MGDHSLVYKLNSERRRQIAGNKFKTEEAEVVVVGSCNTDLISYAPRLPKPGETIHGTKFSIGFGGKGANQCVMAARLEAKTAMVSKVGDDAFGNETIKNFKENGVITEFVSISKGASTGVAPIAVNEQGQNAIIIVPGANMLITPTEVEDALSKLPSVKVLLCQLEINMDATLAALKYGKSKGILTILNPAPAVEKLDPEYYKNCDIFCPNETETEILTGLPVTNIDEAKTAAIKLIELGCTKVIITMGGNGAVLITSDNSNPVHITTQKVTPVDTTGAGDAFVGSLAYFLAYHSSLPIPEMIKRACHIATISVGNQGTQKSFPWKGDLPEELLK
ncbi:ribokinase-like [Amphiura filiformis]|uniref:ribokinase-like n=1 Tax=Amphiura filiformis TaxID=82378 RepID=UPI003B214227